ncbi:uncharacterized protein LOC135248407 [Anguilla rostrata]|uniref:uncharacterized protein LOC135248407 n=1 Tax=Anguilla rostrata TaxID=7938 RepID=UPI0030D2BC10
MRSLPIPVCSLPFRTRFQRRGPPRQRNPSNLRDLQPATSQNATLAGGLWNCQSATRKADFISAYASHLSLQFLALTETWISPDNSSTPTALSSSFSFSHTPRPSGRGGGTGLLLSRSWNFSALHSHLSLSSFEHHSVHVTHPSNLFISVIYRPPGPLGNFLEELDILLSSFPENGAPLILLGDFNIHLEASQSAAFLPLLHSFDLSLQHSPPTHKAGNLLDLVFLRNTTCTGLNVTPLHTSDHHFVSFSLPLPSHPHPFSPPSPTVSVRRNLCALSPSSLVPCVTASLPPLDVFSALPSDSASDTLLSSLSTAINTLCPLVSRPTRPSPPCPWLTDVLRSSRTALRAAERNWKKSRMPTDLSAYQSLLNSFSSAVATAKATYYHSKIHKSIANPRQLFSIFSSLLSKPSPPTQTSLTAEDFAAFFEAKVTLIRSSLDPPDSHPSLPPSPL